MYIVNDNKKDGNDEVKNLIREVKSFQGLCETLHLLVPTCCYYMKWWAIYIVIKRSFNILVGRFGAV